MLRRVLRLEAAFLSAQEVPWTGQPCAAGYCLLIASGSGYRQGLRQGLGAHILWWPRDLRALGAAQVPGPSQLCPDLLVAWAYPIQGMVRLSSIFLLLPPASEGKWSPSRCRAQGQSPGCGLGSRLFPSSHPARESAVIILSLSSFSFFNIFITFIYLLSFMDACVYVCVFVCLFGHCVHVEVREQLMELVLLPCGYLRSNRFSGFSGLVANSFTH